MHKASQADVPPAAVVGYESVIPNPKLKLLDQVREVMRLKHYSIRTERSYCDWIRRYVHFHGMKSREEMLSTTMIYTHVLQPPGVGCHDSLAIGPPSSGHNPTSEAAAEGGYA